MPCFDRRRGSPYAVIAAVAVATAVAALAACVSQKPAPRPKAGAAMIIVPPAVVPLQYPPVTRSTHVDSYHGKQVPDPYRDLERLDAPATQAFITAQNEISQPYLAAIASRERIRRRLTQLWSYERYSIPITEGGRYFFQRNDGLQNQSVLYVADSLTMTPRVLIDPNGLSQDGTVAMADYVVSPDGTLVAYGISDGGTDWKIWQVRHVGNGRDLDDEVRYTKFSKPSWARDGAGFYYSRYPLGANGRGDDGKQAAVYFHKIGTLQTADRLIYAITDHATRVPYATVTEDGRFLVIDVFDGFAVNGIYYFELPGELTAKATGEPVQKDPVRLFDQWDAHYTFLGNNGTQLYFQATVDAPNGSVVAVDVEGLAARKCECTRNPPLRTIVGQASDALVGASYVGGRILAQYLRDAVSHIRIFDTDGHEVGTVKLPGTGSAFGFAGKARNPETFFSYNDFLTPLKIYRYDVTTGRTEVFRRPTAAIDLADYLTTQVYFKSKDGTRVSMFVTHKKDIALDGKHPTLLYGYGGFKVSMSPTYSPAVAAWLEMGGIYAVANLRGGGEYGEAWHDAGTRLKKQNVFDDFIAAAEYLVAERYTSAPLLAISGGSNGGLLVAATLVQRPELIGAALPNVGVLDMLRYHTASANAHQWSSDYGLSTVAEQFDALYAYSPYHAVEKANAAAAAGTCYPPTLVTTAEHDDRVVPWHSFKFAAALQHAQTCANPILLRVETRAGHGAGKPTWMQIESVADQFAFLSRQFGIDSTGN